jgi:hypothetical protein
MREHFGEFEFRKWDFKGDKEELVVISIRL